MMSRAQQLQSLLLLVRSLCLYSIVMPLEKELIECARTAQLVRLKELVKKGIDVCCCNEVRLLYALYLLVKNISVCAQFSQNLSDGPPVVHLSLSRSLSLTLSLSLWNSPSTLKVYTFSHCSWTERHCITRLPTDTLKSSDIS